VLDVNASWHEQCCDADWNFALRHALVKLVVRRIPLA
jgi:hypothetical protein